MDIGEYLQSEQAVMDVAHLVSIPDGEPTTSRLGQDDDLTWWRGWNGMWKRVWINDGRDGLMVHFRPDGDRFIVTDMGEGMQAYALRTGDIEYRGLHEPPSESGILDRDGRIYACCTRGDRLYLGIEPDDLPRAIVCVMLAAYRVANLDENGRVK